MFCQTFWILLFFQATSANGQDNETFACRVNNSNIEAHQQLFHRLMSTGRNKLIYIYLHSSGFDEIADDEFDKNRMAEWIWVTPDYKHLLQYPLDIDVYTFSLLRKEVDKLKLEIEIENITLCQNISQRDFIQSYISQVVNLTKPNTLCHRYFRDQGFKAFLFKISHVSIGYDFECLENAGNSSLSYEIEIISKSPIIYAITAIVILLIAYYPAVLSLIFQGNDFTRQLHYYSIADYPYTPRRGLLYVVFYGFQNSSINAIRLSLIFLCFGGVLYLIKKELIWNHCDCIPSDESLYPGVFELTTSYRESDKLYLLFLFIAFIMFFFTLNVGGIYFSMRNDDSIIVVDFLNCLQVARKYGSRKYFVFFHFIPIKSFMDENDDSINITIFSKIVYRFRLLISITFWCKVFIFPMRYCKNIKNIILKIVYITVAILHFPLNACVFIFPTIVPTWNTICSFANLVKIPKVRKTKIVVCMGRLVCQQLLIVYCVTLCSFSFSFFAKNVFMLGMVFFIQSIIYTVFVAMPHLYLTQLNKFVLILMFVIYILRYIKSVIDIYRALLLKLLQILKKDEIPIKWFEVVAAHFYPLRNQLFLFLIKTIMLLLTMVIVFSTIETINVFDKDGSNDFYAISTLVISLIAPGILDKYCFESIQDNLERNTERISEFIQFSPPSQMDTEEQGNSNKKITTECLRIGRQCIGAAKTKCIICCNSVYEEVNESNPSYETCSIFEYHDSQPRSNKNDESTGNNV